MLRRLLYYLVCLLWVGGCISAYAGDDEKDWVSGSVLEELWKNEKLKDISQKELREKLLDDAPWWQFSANQWRALDNENCTFASEAMQDVLFVWQQFPISNTVKANEGEAGLVTRLTHISSLMYLRKGSEEKDIDPASSMSESIVKNLTKFFNKNPLKEKSSSSKKQTSERSSSSSSSSSKKQTNENSCNSECWKWVTKEGTAVLKVGYVMSGGKSRKMVVDYILLTLTPAVKRAQLETKSSTASEKKRVKDKEPINLQTLMMERLSECIMHNEDKLRPPKEDEEDYALPATLAFLNSLKKESKDLHEYMISIRGRGNLVGPKAWAQLKQDIDSIIEKNERGFSPDKHDKVIGYAEWGYGYVISRAYALEKEWINHYNLSVQRIKRELPVADRKQIVYLNKQDYTTDQISPKVLLRMKHDHRGNFLKDKSLFLNRKWNENRAQNEDKDIKLWFVTHGLIEEDGHKEGILRTNVRLILKINGEGVEYAEFRRRGIYRSTLPIEKAYLISEYYGL